MCAKTILDRLLLPALKVPRGLTLSLVSATLRSNPISVDSKPLTGMLSPLDATLTQNKGGGVLYGPESEVNNLGDARRKKKLVVVTT